MSERITYRQLKPFCLPTSLDDLSGPHTGSLRLPIHLCWSPGDHVFDLARLGDALTVYQCVIAEGTTQEQHEYLNHALLIELWPHLHLDVRIIAAWENTFDSLRGKTNGGASTPHPRTRRNSIPVAQECTPPASLCRGFRHTRATIGDVGKPRAIRQNTLVGAVPGVAAWVDEFVPADHVVGQSGGALDPPARRLTGSSHVRVCRRCWIGPEWAGVQVVAWAACPSSHL